MRPDVRKVVEPCFSKIFRVCGREMSCDTSFGKCTRKPALPNLNFIESSRLILATISSKTSSKVGKSNTYGDCVIPSCSCREVLLPKDQDKIDRVCSRHQHSLTCFAECE
ncbi:uncharacterized protein LOC105179067 isoform X1 [Sesamum indicum]|uniref:Uncharacterized protein LOC105179067 isoform X1 n=1 Tax=Sesamum indicum TaxID=4182 RepID=A0A8M8USG8_SESIN|nr:uncharacterized protein LOC105179067 isoform X1 [Sesamum indicum]